MTKKNYHNFVSPYLMWIIVCAGIVLAFWLVPNANSFIIYPHPALYILSGLALAYWIYFFMKGVTSNLEGSFRPHHITKVVTSGPYALVRHPVYSADVVLAWGVMLAYPMYAVLVSVIWLTIVLIVWMYLEEKSMTELFGPEYKEYKKKVPMLFPKLRS